MKTTKIRKRNIKSFCLAVVLSLFTLGIGVFSAQSKAPLIASASVSYYDRTRIETDLQGIDESDYPKDKNGTPEVISFQEYCYSELESDKELYGLYFYLYNPTESTVRESKCSANMAVAYDYEGNPIKYENVSLTLLDKTDNQRFLKFKVSDSDKFLTLAKEYASAHNGERRYDVAGVQLFFTNGAATKDIGVSLTYTWTGYAEGINNNAESTLKCKKNKNQTLTLDVNHTYYRDTTGTHVRSTQTIHSVYFSVPNQILEEYGALYQVHAEYLAARLKPALVLGDKEVYDEVSKYLWYDTSTPIETLDYQIASNSFVEADDRLNISAGDFIVRTNYVWNFHQSNFWVGDGFIDYWNKIQEIHPDYANTLYLLFGTDSFAENSADNYIVSSERLKQAMLDTSTHYKSTGTVVGADGEYSKDIFSSIATEKTDVVLTADDTFDLTKEVVNRDFWGNVSIEVENVLVNKPAIYQVTGNDFKALDSVSASNLLVAQSDLSDIKKAYEVATANKETLFLFRYRISDYVSKEAAILKREDPLLQKEAFKVVSTNGYFFEQDADLLFDIIDVMFKDYEGTETVMGVVSEPSDFVPAATPPAETVTDKPSFWEWLKANYKWIILGVVGYLLLCCLGKALYPSCPFIIAGFAAIWWIITLPFRFIIWLIRLIIDKIKERRERRKGDNNDK